MRPQTLQAAQYDLLSSQTAGEEDIPLLPTWLEIGSDYHIPSAKD